jgi:hypothetical protein
MTGWAALPSGNISGHFFNDINSRLLLMNKKGLKRLYYPFDLKHKNYFLADCPSGGCDTTTHSGFTV